MTAYRQRAGAEVAIAHRVTVLWRGAAMGCGTMKRGGRCTEPARYVCETDFGGRRGYLTTEYAVRCEKHAGYFAKRFRLEVPPGAPAPVVPLTFDAWIAEGEQLYGQDRDAWQFVCPSCGNVQSIADFKRLPRFPADVDPRNVANYSCIGRWAGAGHVPMLSGKRPCNYAGGGLFGLNPQKVTTPDGVAHQLFAFADSKGG